MIARATIIFALLVLVAASGKVAAAESDSTDYRPTLWAWVNEGEDVNAQVVRMKRPAWPAEQAPPTQPVQVGVDFFINAKGKAERAAVIRADDFPEAVRKAALDSVVTASYEPAMRNGKPLTKHVMVAVEFAVAQKEKPKTAPTAPGAEMNSTPTPPLRQS